MAKHSIERTLILIKHDGMQRGLVGEIVGRFERKGLKIAAMKMLHPTEELADKHYVMTEAWIKKLAGLTRKAADEKNEKIDMTDEEIAGRVKGWNMKYLTEGPIIAIVFEGYHAIEIGRKISGPAEPRSAPLGTVRGDFSVDSYDMADVLQRPTRNLMHASGNKEEADNEIPLWFSESEIFDYEKEDWKVMH